MPPIPSTRAGAVAHPPEEDQLDEGATDLDAAVAVAVADGLAVVDRLSETVIAAIDRCVGLAETASADHGPVPGGALLAEYASVLRELRQEAERRLTRQRTRLTSFNVVVFGRTGAGKSSLIEALSGGDGAPISTGESDWTTDVRDVHWRSSRLVDTPGIGGWGRTTSRAILEHRAENAVADADVVVLCFDTQSQQTGEFTTVAEWVGRYGKPVVVVLNSRNPHWRNPLKVGSLTRRRDLSKSVLEHASHIRDELALVGLVDVPIVAIHSKRAAFARTTDPYAGPDDDAPSRQKQRDEFGPDQLLAWSNLPALEMLLTQALTQHAAQLRLGMLHDQSAGILRDVEASVGSAHDEATLLATQIERGITDVLGIVGMPTDRELLGRVRALEELRGGFGAAEPSELSRHTRHRFASGLRSARTKALRRADATVEAAYANGGELDARAFSREVLQPARAEIEAVAGSVGREVQTYLAQRLDLVADDVQADIRAAVSSFERADTTAGRTKRTVGLALKTSSGLVSVGIGIAMVVSNPAGWLIGVATLSSVLLSYVGGKVRKKGSADRTAALSAARSGARRAVHDTFDKSERAITTGLIRTLGTAAHARLAQDVGQALALRRISGAASAASRSVRQVVATLPQVDDARHLLTEVAKDVEQREHPGEPTAARLLWLGEQWCTDPLGLTDDDSSAPAAPASTNRTHADRFRRRMRTVSDAAQKCPLPFSGRTWMSDTRGALADDADVLEALAPVFDAAQDAPPRLVIAGDYSTGKSSFIKRLLVDSGARVPDGLDVTAQPRTDRAETFEWGDWELVDTPGFQSGRSDHGQRARDAAVGASILLVLFNPNLVVGSATDLLHVLLGETAAGRVGKLSRMLFVINRADELGIDPTEDPSGHQNLCRRKELELAQALGAIGELPGEGDRAVRAEQIVCVASDPFGLVGDRTDVSRADYDRHRGWDGMDDVRLALTDALVAVRDNAVDLQILERGASALGAVVHGRREVIAYLDATISQSRWLLLDLDACLSTGHAIEAEARERLVTAYVKFVADLFDDAANAAGDKDERHARVERLGAWADDREVLELYREWATRFEKEREEWEETTSKRIDARLTSAAFTAAFDAANTDLDVDHLRPRADPIVRDTLTQTAKAAAEFAAKAPRETVTAIAHAFGHKFAPWGATKLTAQVNKIGGAFGIAFGGFELYSTWRGVQKETDAERTAHEQRGALLQQVRQATEEFFDSPEPDAPRRAMASSLEEVQRSRADLSHQIDELVAERDLLTDRTARCEQRMHDALTRLEATSP